jgi:small-conductance mechanosensitive channel
MLGRLPSYAVKLLPFILFAAFIVITGNTNWFSAALHNQMVSQFQVMKKILLPLALNVASALLILYGAMLSYHAVRNAFSRLFTTMAPNVSEQGRYLTGFLFQSTFWVLVVIVAARIVAPGFVDSLLLSGGLIATGFAIFQKDTIQGFVYSWCLHLKPRFVIGDYIKVVGTAEAEGVVTKIDYVHTWITLKDGREDTIPNSAVWTASIIVGKPPEEEKTDDKAGEKCGCHCCCCQKSADAAVVASETPKAVREDGSATAEKLLTAEKPLTVETVAVSLPVDGA